MSEKLTNNEISGDGGTIEYPPELEHFSPVSELDAARLREQAALEQAWRARESLAAMGKRLAETEHLYAACLAQLDAAKALIFHDSEIAQSLLKRAEEAGAHIAELERDLKAARVALDGDDSAFEAHYHLPMQKMKHERDEAQAHAARLASVLDRAIITRDGHAQSRQTIITSAKWIDDAALALSAAPAEALARLRALENLYALDKRMAEGDTDILTEWEVAMAAVEATRAGVEQK